MSGPENAIVPLEDIRRIRSMIDRYFLHVTDAGWDDWREMLTAAENLEKKACQNVTSIVSKQS